MRFLIKTIPGASPSSCFSFSSSCRSLFVRSRLLFAECRKIRWARNSCRFEGESRETRFPVNQDDGRETIGFCEGPRQRKLALGRRASSELVPG